MTRWNQSYPKNLILPVVVDIALTPQIHRVPIDKFESPFRFEGKDYGTRIDWDTLEIKAHEIADFFYTQVPAQFTRYMRERYDSRGNRHLHSCCTCINKESI